MFGNRALALMNKKMGVIFMVNLYYLADSSSFFHAQYIDIILLFANRQVKCPPFPFFYMVTLAMCESIPICLVPMLYQPSRSKSFSIFFFDLFIRPQKFNLLSGCHAKHGQRKGQVSWVRNNCLWQCWSFPVAFFSVIHRTKECKHYFHYSGTNGTPASSDDRRSRRRRRSRRVMTKQSAWLNFGTLTS